jgi:hypothetical protein
MSQENVEVARTVLDTFNREGSPPPLRSPTKTSRPTPSRSGQDPICIAGWTVSPGWSRNGPRTSTTTRWDPHRFIDAGQRVVILARHGGDTKDQGVAVDQPIGAVYLDRGAADSPNGLLPDLAGGSRSRRAPGDRPPAGQVGPLRRVGGSAGRQRALCQLPAAS